MGYAGTRLGLIRGIDSLQAYRVHEDGVFFQAAHTVIFRTQSAALIRSMTEFFRIWKSIEDAHLRPLMEQEPPKYALYDGKFIRSISVPAHDCSSDELAKVIAEYIKLFDTMMKGYLSGRLSARDIEACYFSQLRRADILI